MTPRTLLCESQRPQTSRQRPFSQSRTKPRHCPEWDIEYVFGRAVESVVSPLGWDGADIRRELAETQVPELTTFTNTAILTNTNPCYFDVG